MLRFPASGITSDRDLQISAIDPTMQQVSLLTQIKAQIREIEKVYSGQLPHLHAQSSCRCPPSHPRVHPLVERYCIPNAADDTTNNRVLRLNLDAHPLHYINDNDIGTSWVSSILSTPEKLDEGVTITMDLENGQYQVFYVILQFQSAQAEAVRIQRKTSGGSGWKDWQYLAKNCSFFGMEDNGPLDRPDSVNCLQFPSDVPYSRGNITFSMLTPEPNLRPGYNNFYNSATLQEFVRATHVQIHLQGQYHTRGAHVPFRHRYYAVDEITISGSFCLSVMFVGLMEVKGRAFKRGRGGAAAERGPF
ncbi:hypothetical protein SRHO_G00128200 [Serrasalmus rhombeus]